MWAFFLYIQQGDIRNMEKMNNNRYSVYVGGIEVNDFYLTLDEAKRLKKEYDDDGYDDAIIVKYEDSEV